MSSPQDPMTPGPRADATAAAAARTAGAAALNAVVPAIAQAAANASRGGISSSEFKVAVGGVVVSALLAGLQALALMPGPWTVPAAIAGAALSAAAYSWSRGTVKVAALRSATELAALAAPPADPYLLRPPPP